MLQHHLSRGVCRHSDMNSTPLSCPINLLPFALPYLMSHSLPEILRRSSSLQIRGEKQGPAFRIHLPQDNFLSERQGYFSTRSLAQQTAAQGARMRLGEDVLKGNSSLQKIWKYSKKTTCRTSLAVSENGVNPQLLDILEANSFRKRVENCQMESRLALKLAEDCRKEQSQLGEDLVNLQDRMERQIAETAMEYSTKLNNCYQQLSLSRRATHNQVTANDRQASKLELDFKKLKQTSNSCLQRYEIMRTECIIYEKSEPYPLNDSFAEEISSIKKISRGLTTGQVNRYGNQESLLQNELLNEIEGEGGLAKGKRVSWLLEGDEWTN